MEYVLVNAVELKQMAEDVKYLKQAVSKILEENDDWLSTDDVLKFLNCCTKTLYTYRQKGEINYHQRGRKTWYSKKDVLGFLEKYNVKIP